MKFQYFEVLVFNKKKEKCPIVYSIGDIIYLHNFSVSTYLKQAFTLLKNKSIFRAKILEPLNYNRTIH